MDTKELPARPSLEQYKKQAKDLLQACKSRANGPATWADLARERGLICSQAVRQIKKHYSRLSRVLDSDVLSARFALADAQFVVAREHGFESWPKFAKHIAALARKSSTVSKFESAADAVITGDVATLKRLLRGNPRLIRERSTRAHHATLLHYVAANGVEDYRQKTPRNVVEVAKLLLQAGAEVDATAEAYSGGDTTLGLAASSVHPLRAGVQSALLETLLD